MSDDAVAKALLSDARLVVVEAPAGCGKTHQGAEYARALLPRLSAGRLLILTHTNAACDVFISRTKGFGSRVEIRTIDHLITAIATSYHKAIGLPSDVANWARAREEGFDLVAEKVAGLLGRVPSIAHSLAVRHPYVICDEHQDSSEYQNEVILQLYRAGCLVRIFGDPMQSLYARTREDRVALKQRWDSLGRDAGHYVELQIAHRWKKTSPELGDWVLQARETLKSGGKVSLKVALPRGLTLIKAENQSAHHIAYDSDARAAINRIVAGADDLLVLAARNETVQMLRGYFYRRLPIWEGHTRDAMSKLAQACQDEVGKAEELGGAYIDFVQQVTTGFSNSKYANIMRRELIDGCRTRRRGMPEKLQHIARCIVESPDHKGVANGLEKLFALIREDADFRDVHVDLWREYREAMQFGRYDSCDVALAEIIRKRK